MKKFEILWELPKRDRYKWANAVGEMATIDLVSAGLPQASDVYEMPSASICQVQ